jgi:hypothetical protein
VADANMRIRANRSTGELEIEGPASAVAEWWDRVWPQMDQNVGSGGRSLTAQSRSGASAGETELPDLFGEFYNELRSDISDVDKTLAAAVFVQKREADRCFTTKAANQVLLDQNIKVTNASECVRRLVQTKRVFIVSAGKFRVSASGFEQLEALKAKH